LSKARSTRTKSGFALAVPASAREINKGAKRMSDPIR
jgi:hypothetical protein